MDLLILYSHITSVKRGPLKGAPGAKVTFNSTELGVSDIGVDPKCYMLT